MNRTSRTAGLLVLLLAAFAGLGRSASPTSVLLISVDTLRPDRLGCYKSRKVLTPHLDALARGGTLFTAANTTAPLTLPAHTSLMTSTYPFTHGVEENGQQVPPEALTLASVLKARGYRTAAFIGGYVLDARFGLNQGFDVYDSPFHLSPLPGEDPPDVKRPAEEVLATAAKWIQEKAGPRWFAFVHLYDAHQPYTHGGYDAEVAYIDQAFGKFQQALNARDLLENTLVVLTSDHGESLGEHGEETHGYFIYQSTLRIPLILHWPEGLGPFPTRIDAPASLIDLAPTLLDALAIPAPPQFQGCSLLKQLDERPVYAESMYAHDHLACSPLRSVQLGKYKYIEAPKPELYDLASDPGESHNRYDRDRAIAENLRGRLLSTTGVQRAGAPKPVSPEVLSRLRSLGYLGGGSAHSGTGPDPKDRLEQYRRYGNAIRLANTGRLPAAIAEFHKLLDEDRKNVLAHFYLAVCNYRLHRFEEAAKALNETLAVSPDYPPAEELLGSIWLLEKDYVRARKQFARLAEVAPKSYGAHYNLGILAMREGRGDEALRELKAAAGIEPGSAQAHAALGSVYYTHGEFDRASDEFHQAIAIDPGDQASRKTLEQLQKSGASLKPGTAPR